MFISLHVMHFLNVDDLPLQFSLKTNPPIIRCHDLSNHTNNIHDAQNYTGHRRDYD